MTAVAKMESATASIRPRWSPAAHPDFVVGADGLSDDWIQPHDHAPPEDDGGEEINITQRDARQRHALEVADHDDVDHAHHHHPDLRKGDRGSQTPGAAQIVAVWNEWTQGQRNGFVRRR